MRSDWERRGITEYVVRNSELGGCPQENNNSIYCKCSSLSALQEHKPTKTEQGVSPSAQGVAKEPSLICAHSACTLSVDMAQRPPEPRSSRNTSILLCSCSCNMVWCHTVIWCSEGSSGRCVVGPLGEARTASRRARAPHPPLPTNHASQGPAGDRHNVFVLMWGAALPGKAGFGRGGCSAGCPHTCWFSRVAGITLPEGITFSTLGQMERSFFCRAPLTPTSWLTPSTRSRGQN